METISIAMYLFFYLLFMLLGILLIVIFLPKWLLMLRAYIIEFLYNRKKYPKYHEGNRPTLGEIHDLTVNSIDYKYHSCRIFENFPILSHAIVIFFILYDIIRLLVQFVCKFYNFINFRGYVTKTFVNLYKVLEYVVEKLIVIPFKYIERIIKKYYTNIVTKISNIKI